MVMVWQLMVRVYVAPVPVQPFASVAVTVIGNVPTCEVVPERMPVGVLSVMPAGSVPVSDQVDRADAAGLREGLAERRAGRAGVVGRVGDGDGWQAMIRV